MGLRRLELGAVFQHREHYDGELVSRPEELHPRPLAERSVRTLASLRSHQANVPIMPICQ